MVRAVASDSAALALRRHAELATARSLIGTGVCPRSGRTSGPRGGCACLLCGGEPRSPSRAP